MSKSATRMTQDVITAIETKAPAITVPVTSTTSNIYKLVNPVAEAAAPVAADAERTLFAISFLGATGRFLDNVLKDINSQRLPDESDYSVKVNAPKIFTPNSAIDTIINPDAIEDQNPQLADVTPQTQDQLFAHMKARFFKLQGAMDLPMMGARYWSAMAFMLGLQYSFIASLMDDYIIEESPEIGNTDWIYNFDARRVPGVRDSKVEISDYNEITIHIYVDERSGTDSRGVKVIYNESEIISQVNDLAAQHLPPPDMRTLQAPFIIVRAAQVKPVYVRGIVSGTASLADVRQAVQDHFYDNKKIGEPITRASLITAILAVPGVSGVSLDRPSDDSLTPSLYEILDVGYIDLTSV